MTEAQRACTCSSEGASIFGGVQTIAAELLERLERHGAGEDLLAYLRGETSSDGEPGRQGDAAELPLASLLTRLLHTSLSTEEGQLPAACVVVQEPQASWSDEERASGREWERARWHLSRFDARPRADERLQRSRISGTRDVLPCVGMLRKLAPICDPASMYLAVEHHDGWPDRCSWRIAGVASPPARDLTHGDLTFSILGPGHVVALHAGVEVWRCQRGYVEPLPRPLLTIRERDLMAQPLDEADPSLGDVRSDSTRQMFWGLNAAVARGDMEELWDSLPAIERVVGDGNEDQLHNIAVLKELIFYLAQGRRGGLVLIEGDVKQCLEVRYRSHRSSPRRFDHDLSLEQQVELETDWSDGLIDQPGEDPADFRHFVYARRTRAQRTGDTTASELLALIEAYAERSAGGVLSDIQRQDREQASEVEVQRWARLCRVDGGLHLKLSADGSLRVNGFGAVVRPTDDPQEVYTWVSGFEPMVDPSGDCHANSLRRFDLRARGTKHRAAASFAANDPTAMSIAVSHDGQAGVFLQWQRPGDDECKLLYWPIVPELPWARATRT